MSPIINAPVRNGPLARTGLPYELLAKILLYGGNFGIKIPADLAATSPWNFACVCSSWKVVAESMPEFWTSIAIDFKNWSNHVGHIYLVNAILSRQPQSLVSLTIKSGYGAWPDVYYPMEYVANHFLNLHCGKFKSLCCEGGYFSNSFLEQPPGSVDSLENLRWSVDRGIRSGLIFRDALRLRKVFIAVGAYPTFLSPVPPSSSVTMAAVNTYLFSGILPRPRRCPRTPETEC